MKAEKVTVTIKVEALSIDALDGLLGNVIEQVNRESETGLLAMSDGDQVSWSTKRESVKF